LLHDFLQPQLFHKLYEALIENGIETTAQGVLQDIKKTKKIKLSSFGLTFFCHKEDFVLEEKIKTIFDQLVECCQRDRELKEVHQPIGIAFTEHAANIRMMEDCIVLLGESLNKLDAMEKSQQPSILTESIRHFIANLYDYRSTGSHANIAKPEDGYDPLIEVIEKISQDCTEFWKGMVALQKVHK
jgi:hypothetical protein